MFKEDEFIWKRPKCVVKDCQRDGFIMFQNKLICGDCYHQVQQNIQEEQRKNSGLVFE